VQLENVVVVVVVVVATIADVFAVVAIGGEDRSGDEGELFVDNGSDPILMSPPSVINVS
jgi:hypothetical protein